MIVTRRNSNLLLTARPFASSPLTPGPSGVGGVAIYRTASSSGDPPAIAYRRLRFTRSGGQSIQRSHRRKTEAVALITEPTTEATLSTVDGAAYRVGLRAWRDDVENPQTYGEQLIHVDGDGNAEPIFQGSGYVFDVVKREAGGMLVQVAWHSPDALPPDTITLTRVSGPTSVADVQLPFSVGQRNYTFAVGSLQDGGTYVFQVIAEKGGYTIRAKASPTSTETDFTFVADASGPSAVASITVIEA